MSWSIDLWDQFDNISKHTAKGIDFFEKLGHFVKERCVVETEYACGLKKLVKTYDVKKKNETDKDFTYCQAFSSMLKELSEIAGQHEVVAETMTVQIVRDIAIISKELREERKRHLNEASKYQISLNSSLAQLEKSKRSYDKAFKESEKAHENYQKADKDLNLSRAELEKSKTIALNKERACEDCKTSYARQLQIVNEAQRDHYTKLMPKIFQLLQDMEARRIENMRKFIQLSSNMQKNVMPIIAKCLDGICESANLISPEADAQLVVDRFKSGMQPPDDIPFEDLSVKTTNGDNESTHSKGNSLLHSHPSKSDYLRHTFTARSLKKRTILLSIFGANKNEYCDLTPVQKRKQLQDKINQLNKQIEQSTNGRNGLITMKQAYEENGAFGDPKTIETQIKETDATLMKLGNELKKHTAILEELDISSKPNSISEHDSISNSPSLTSPVITKQTTHPNSQQLSRTNSETSIKSDADGNKDTTTPNSTNNRTSNSFIDSYSDSASQTNSVGQALDCVDSKIPNSKNQSENIDSENCDSYEAPLDLPAQAFARALYPFKENLQSDGPLGSIPMFENELFDVIEFDHGDGWTRVRRKIFDHKDEDVIGFVPTSYIHIDSNLQS